MYMDRFDDPRMAVYHVLYARTSGCRVVLGFRPQSMLKTNALLILQLFATQARNRLTVRASLNFNAALCHPYTSRLRAFGRIKMVAKMKDDLVGDDGAGCEFRVYDVHPNATSVFSHPTTSYKAESNRHVLSSKSHDSVPCKHMLAQVAHLSVLPLIGFDCTKSHGTMLELAVSQIRHTHTRARKSPRSL